MQRIEPDARVLAGAPQRFDHAAEHTIQSPFGLGGALVSAFYGAAVVDDEGQNLGAAEVDCPRQNTGHDFLPYTAPFRCAPD